jgi:hypothetical protein
MQRKSRARKRRLATIGWYVDCEVERITGIVIVEVLISRLFAVLTGLRLIPSPRYRSVTRIGNIFKNINVPSSYAVDTKANQSHNPMLTIYTDL